MKRRFYGLIVFYSLLMMQSGYASLKNELDKAFDQLSGSSTSTSAQAYKGQRAGYYTGGSYSSRNQVRTYHIANARFPRVTAGCGGIDIFTGGLSFINSDELKDSLKNIANNAAAYSFMLGLETISPVIKNQIESLSTKADAINRMNINSCEMGAALVGSAWPKTDAASEKVCETLAMSNNAVSDRVKARHHCANPALRKRTVENAKQSGNADGIIFDDTNLAWKLINKQSQLKSDKQFAELLMSLSGTIVIQSGRDNLTPRTYPSLINSTGMITSLLEGGDITVYQCDESASCLNLSVTTQTISTKQAFGARVGRLLQSMQEKIKSDVPLSEEEIRLLGSTELPVYKILNVQSAFEGGDSLIGLSDYANVIALDMIYHYLNQNLMDLSNQTPSLSAYPPHLLKEYQNMLSHAVMQIRHQQHLMMQKQQVNTNLIERTMELEKSLSGRLSTDVASHLRWSNSFHPEG